MAARLHLLCYINKEAIDESVVGERANVAASHHVTGTWLVV
jgi:hypothetical protein